MKIRKMEKREIEHLGFGFHKTGNHGMYIKNTDYYWLCLAPFWGIMWHFNQED
jgi:hypothetical protein